MILSVFRKPLLFVAIIAVTLLGQQTSMLLVNSVSVDLGFFTSLVLVKIIGLLALYVAIRFVSKGFDPLWKGTTSAPIKEILLSFAGMFVLGFGVELLIYYPHSVYLK